MDDPIALLQKIADNTSHDNSWWVAMIAGGAGVLGAGLTAYFSYRIAIRSQQTEEKRLRAEVVTAERLRWLQDIRQRLSRFYAQLDMQYSYLKRPVPAGGQPDYQKEVDVFSNEINEQCNIITLMLNPQKQHQANLRDALHQALGFMVECVGIKSNGSTNFEDKKYLALKNAAFNSLTIIGIETWDRIKQLE